MRYADPGPDWASWRQAARALVTSGVPPEEVIWAHEDETWLPLASTSPASADNDSRESAGELRVPAAFVALAKTVLCHADEQRWGLLYRLLWRVTRGSEAHLLRITSDPDVISARHLEKAVHRGVHKMHAFVRFRKAGQDEDGREYFVAWFEPEHHIIELAAPFFRERFANMDWSIFSPRGCLHWIDRHQYLTPGISHDLWAGRDDLESLWKTYYASIFNPARVKLKAMQAEMPKKFWKNLPETELITSLTRDSAARLQSMMAQPLLPPRALPRQPYLEALTKLPRAEEETPRE